MIKNPWSFLAKHRYLIIFSVIAVVGFALRLSAAITQDFWMDEVSIFHVARDNSLKDMLFMNHWDKSHPQLFYIFMHFWQKINTTAFFLRLPTLLIFIPTLILLYKVYKSVFYAKYALVTSGLFSIHPFFVNLGFQHKPYGFTFFLITFAMFASLKLFESPQKKWLLGTIVSSVLGFYTDYSFIWFLAAWNLSWFILIFSTQRSLLRLFLKTNLIMLILVSFQIFLLVRDFSQALALEKYVGEVNRKTLEASYYIFSGLYKWQPGPLFMYLGIAAILVINFWLSYRLELLKQKHLAFFSSLAFLVPIITCFAISQHSPIFVYRNLFIVAFLFIFGITNFFSLTRIKHFHYLIFGGLIIYSGLLLSTSAKQFGFNGSQDYKTIASFIKTKPGNKLVLVINLPPFMITSLENFYMKGFEDKIPDPNVTYKVIQDITPENTAQLHQVKLNEFEHVVILIEKDSLTAYPNFLTSTMANLNCQSSICHKPFPIPYD